jgi:hypothetical protein
VHVVRAAARGGRGPPFHVDEQDLDRLDRPGVGNGADPCHQAIDVRKPAFADPDHTAAAHLDGSSADIGGTSVLVPGTDASQLRPACDEP